MNLLKFLLLALLYASSLFSETSYQDLEYRVKLLEEQLTELLEKQATSKDKADTYPIDQISISEEKSLFERFSKEMHQKEEDKLYPWLDLKKWDSLKLGMNQDTVREILGKPTLDEISLNKRIDNVFTYKGRVISTNKKVEGKVRFYKDESVEILPPEK
jgi:hypothetical protein